jgi:MoaA/NifB/PqqE/SkfB family radical SAM enzyme
MDGYKKTKRKVLTRRGVVWLGQTCNLRCHFCYFLNRIDDHNHPEHAFMPLEKAKKICQVLASYYGNCAVDLQGGEPTLYRHIMDLVAFCRGIGLLPTLITNALVIHNLEYCSRLRDAGIRDLLVSVQGIGGTYDEIVGVKNAYNRHVKGLENISKAGIPVRFNCVLSKKVLPQLEQIAELALACRARVVNFIAFNPFEDQRIEGNRNKENVPRYREVAEYLGDAIDKLEEAGVETNVRYFPLCILPEKYRKNVYDFQQLPNDIHEWDLASWTWTSLSPQRLSTGEPSRPVRLEDYTYTQVEYSGPWSYLAGVAKKVVHRYPRLRQPAEQVNRLISFAAHPLERLKNQAADSETLYRRNAMMRASRHCRYDYSKTCHHCAAREICDGFHGDYAQIFGVEEAQPIEHYELIKDPKFFIQHQEKIVDEHDYQWAL